MKYIYILGLEHSGTTLLDHSLSSSRNVVGLGEVASFFSSHHMNDYMARWGNISEAQKCSCGEPWDNCEFWSKLYELNGLYSEVPLIQKYQRLIEHARQIYGEDVVLIDSSKSLEMLNNLWDCRNELGLSKDNFLVILAVKDVRCFAMSMARKTSSDRAFSLFRAFNLWKGANESYINYIEE